MFNIIQDCQEKLDNYSIFYYFLGKPIVLSCQCILFKLPHGKPDNTEKRKKQSVIFLSTQKGSQGDFHTTGLSLKDSPQRYVPVGKELRIKTSLRWCKWTRRFPPPSWDKKQLDEPMASVSNKRAIFISPYYAVFIQSCFLFRNLIRVDNPWLSFKYYYNSILHNFKVNIRA